MMLALMVTTRSMTVEELGWAVGSLATGVVIGLAVYRVLRRRIQRDETIARWGARDLVVRAIRTLAIVWCSTGGLYVAAQMTPLSDAISIVVEKLVAGALIGSGTIVAARTAGDLIKVTSLRTSSLTRGSSILLNVVRVAVVLVGLLVLLQTFGVKVTPLLAALGIGGLAIALALKEPLADLFAGLQLLATKKVRPGQYVRLGDGQEGYIADIDWRHTSIRQLPDNMLLVPNARLADAAIMNFDYPHSEMALLVDVRVGYESDLDHVESVTKAVARSVMQDTEGAVPSSVPFVRYHTFGDHGIDFTVVMRIQHVIAQHVVKHEFIKRLKRTYREEGIDIPYPTVRLDGQTQTRTHRSAARGTSSRPTGLPRQRR